MHFETFVILKDGEAEKDTVNRFFMEMDSFY